MVEKARNFAIKAHGKQKYGIHPYQKHLDDVVNILHNYGDNAKIIGYLHDVVEDTQISLDEIEKEFGELVAKCVSILTDEKDSDDEDRNSIKQKTYSKMAKVEGDEKLALIVKAADRLANIEACIVDKRFDKLKMYFEEHEKFQKAVYRKGLCDDIWERINSIITNENYNLTTYNFSINE